MEVSEIVSSSCRRLSWLVMGLVVLGAPAHSATDTVLILYTNDFHDHIRAGYGGVGGMPYVSGYIRSAARGRKDALILDAGDVMEKGDMLAFQTQSRVMYEAMGRIGYHAGVMGNHDGAYGIPHLKACAALAGYDLLCLNLVAPDGTRPLPASTVLDVDGVKVGIVGLLTEKDYTLPLAESVRLLADEAARLDEQAHLVVAVCHLGSGPCRAISPEAPAVDVFVSGHTHEALREPRIVDETGAIIVQAGRYAQYVGRLEVTLDLDTEAILRTKGELVEMQHDAVPCDRAMEAWIQEQEQALCPEADRVVGRTHQALGQVEVARLAAAALRERAGADVGFCHSAKVMRSGLPAGCIDVNALFLTGGQRGHTIVSVDLAGKDIVNYLNDLAARNNGRTQWSGFRATSETSTSRVRTYTTDLQPERMYKVVLPKREWDSYLRPLLARQGRPHDAAQCAFTFTEAFADYAAALTERGCRLQQRAEDLARAQDGAPAALHTE